MADLSRLRPRRDWRRIRRIVLRSVGVLAIVAVGFVGWHGVRLWLAWQSFDHVDFDLDASRAALPSLPPDTSTTTTAPVPDDEDDGPAPAPPPPRPPLPFLDDPDLIDVFVLIGSDQDKGEIDNLRADAILLYMWPRDAGSPVLTSLPRDLYLRSLCTGERERISVALEGCDDIVSGPELLSLTVEDFTGLEVDHFAIISFDGFEDIIDRLDGIEICADNRLRLDTLEIPAGCSDVDGQRALQYIRNRTPQELIDGEWVPAVGGDLARSLRQQELLIQLLRRLRGFRSPLELSNLVSDLSDAFVLDEELDLPSAIDLAWDMRRLSPTDVQRVVLPTESGVTDDGEFIRLPSQPFEELLYSVYGGADIPR